MEEKYEKGKSVFDKGYNYEKERLGEGGNTAGGDLIRGASSGLGAWLAWQLLKKDERTPEEKKKADENWEKKGKPGCIKFIILVILIIVIGHFVEQCNKPSIERESKQNSYQEK